MESVCVPPLASQNTYLRVEPENDATKKTLQDFINNLPKQYNPNMLMPLTSKLSASLSKAQGEFPVIPRAKTARIKTKSGGEFSYSYADLADILKLILPILSKNGLSLSQPIVREEGKSYLRTILRHESGEQIQDFGIPLNESLGHQEYGGELTFWRRYGLSSLLGISTEEDTDASPVTAKKTKVQVLDKDLPTADQYEEYGKKVRNYGVDVKTLGHWVKNFAQVEDTKKLTNKQWQDIFNTLDAAQKQGDLAEFIHKENQ